MGYSKPLALRAKLWKTGESQAVGFSKQIQGDFPGGAVVKKPPANAGD